MYIPRSLQESTRRQERSLKSMRSVAEATRTSLDPRMSQPRVRLNPSLTTRRRVRRKRARRSPRRMRTEKRPKIRRSLRPTVARKRLVKRPRQSPKHPRRRRRHQQKVRARALVSLVAVPSVALLKSPRKRKHRRRRQRMERSDQSFKVAGPASTVLSLLLYGCVCFSICNTLRRFGYGDWCEEYPKDVLSQWSIPFCVL